MTTPTVPRMAQAFSPAVPLPRAFYSRPTAEVARALLGMRLVRDLPGEQLTCRIVETEAYGSALDSASHASKGRTPRTDPMFGPAGHAYVYLIYGLYNLLNIVTEPEGTPGAVLIRAVQPIAGEELMRVRGNGKPYPGLCNGPGKLTRAMDITRTDFNRHDLCRGEALWVAAGEPIADPDVVLGPRVGIDYAAPEDRDAPLRFRIGMDPRRVI